MGRSGRCWIPVLALLRFRRFRERAKSEDQLEGLNSKVRLIKPRGYGHLSAAALIAMICLCCGGITVQLPTER